MKKRFLIDICPECKVREGDSSKKKLYRCRHCERYFCKRHLSPRLTAMRSAIEEIKDPILRNEVYEEWRKPNGHPDWIWTKKYFEELELKEGEKREKIWKVLDQLKEEKRPIEKELFIPLTEEPQIPIKKERSSFKSNFLVFVLLSMVIILSFIFLKDYINLPLSLNVVQAPKDICKRNIEKYLEDAKVKLPSSSEIEVVKVEEFKDENSALNYMDSWTSPLFKMRESYKKIENDVKELEGNVIIGIARMEIKGWYCVFDMCASDMVYTAAVVCNSSGELTKSSSDFLTS